MIATCDSPKVFAVNRGNARFRLGIAFAPAIDGADASSPVDRRSNSVTNR
jgi:hypothetical protein